MRSSDVSSDVCSSDLHATVNPKQQGTKFGAVHQLTVAPGQTGTIELVLSALPRAQPLIHHEQIFSRRLSEANAFFSGLLPEATAQKSVGTGKRVSVSVDLGGRRIIKQTKTQIT